MALYTLNSGFGENTTDTNITRQITLEGVSYTFNFRYNTRDESWVISVGFLGNLPLFTVKATTNRVLNSQYTHLVDAPKGSLVVIDTTESNGRIDFENFYINGRYRLGYLESGGLNA